MPFMRPTLTQLFNRSIAIINSKIPGADALLQKSILRIIALVISEMINGNYGYLQFLSLQLFATTCEDEFLATLASIRNIIKKSAMKASGTVTCTGTNGSVITIGTQLQRADGVFYVVTQDIAISSGTAAVIVEAQDVGELGNADTTTVLTFVTPPLGVNSTGIVASPGLAGGTNIETDDQLRARYLEFIQNPPQGGAKSDYKLWAESVQGVTVAFVYPIEFGLGTVTVRFLVEPTPSNPNGIPTPDDVQRVKDYIETKRPVTALDVYVVAPNPVPLNIEIELEVKDNIDIQNAVKEELQAMFLRDSIPGGTIYISRINEAISLAAGEYAHILLAPTLDISNATNDMSVLGTVTFT